MIYKGESMRNCTLCVLHENHFASRCNLSPNTRIMAATRRVLSKLFPCVNEWLRSKICITIPLDHNRYISLSCALVNRPIYDIYIWKRSLLDMSSPRNIKDTSQLDETYCGWRYYGRCYRYLFDRCVDIFPWKVQRAGGGNMPGNIVAGSRASLERIHLASEKKKKKKRQKRTRSSDCIAGTFANYFALD